LGGAQLRNESAAKKNGRLLFGTGRLSFVAEGVID